MKQSSVNLLVWSGDTEKAKEVVGARFPGHEVSLIDQRRFREAGWRGQLEQLRDFRGRALIFFFESCEQMAMPQVLSWTGLRHRCEETVLADANGLWYAYRRRDWPRMLPKLILSAGFDCFVFAASWLLLKIAPTRRVPLRSRSGQASGRIAYLFPFPLDNAQWGGSVSHVQGVLRGLSRAGASCKVFSTRPLPGSDSPALIVPFDRKNFLFPESVALRFNLAFARKVYAALKKSPPEALYQRHRRFTFSGALLSQWLRVPFVLEYNGSELWSAQHWDPARFGAWLKLCEEFSLNCASLIVVVSEVLRDELLSRGIDAERILVNPNGVDPDIFHPGCGGTRLREQMGFAPGDIVVGFVGTFSYWHGVDVLRDAILQVLDNDAHIAAKLKFLLIGQGPLLREMQEAVLGHPRAAGRIVFTGPVSHRDVPAHLDAADVLISPHVPMPDGSRFFGSPTKLFEYMAMGKGIVASNLDQLATVLKDNETAVLAVPGDVRDLVEKLYAVASDDELRLRIGNAARASAIAKYTWTENAGKVLRRLRPDPGTESKSSQAGIPALSNRCDA